MKTLDIKVSLNVSKKFKKKNNENSFIVPLNGFMRRVAINPK